MSKKEMGDWIKLGESHINSSARRLIPEDGGADNILEWLHELLYNQDVDVSLVKDRETGRTGLEISLQDDDTLYIIHASISEDDADFPDDDSPESSLPRSDMTKTADAFKDKARRNR